MAEPPKREPAAPKDFRGKETTVDAGRVVETEPLCPEGQLPFPREFQAPKGNPFFSGTSVDAPYNYADAWASAGGSIPLFDGGGVVSKVENPAISSGGGAHSLFEISVQGGVGNGNIVEIGWIKNVGDEFPAALRLPLEKPREELLQRLRVGAMESQHRAGYGGRCPLEKATWVGCSIKATGGRGTQTSGSAIPRRHLGRRLRQGVVSAVVRRGLRIRPHPGNRHGQWTVRSRGGGGALLVSLQVDAGAWVCSIHPTPSLNAPSIPWYTIQIVGGSAHRYGGPGGRVGAGLDP